MKKILVGAALVLSFSSSATAQDGSWKAIQKEWVDTQRRMNNQNDVNAMRDRSIDRSRSYQMDRLETQRQMQREYFENQRQMQLDRFKHEREMMDILKQEAIDED